MDKKQIRRYIDYLSDARYDMPAFLVDRLSWVILSRFNREIGRPVRDNVIHYIPAESRNGHLIPDYSGWTSVFADGEGYYPGYHFTLGFMPYAYRNVEVIDGCFETIEEFKDGMPKGMLDAPELNETLHLFNLDNWESDADEGVYLDFRIEIIRNYDLIKGKRGVKKALERMESPGMYESYYGDQEIIGFYIESGDMLYHTILLGGYGYDVFVCEEGIRPSYSLELLWIDAMIEEQKEVHNECA